MYKPRLQETVADGLVLAIRRPLLSNDSNQTGERGERAPRNMPPPLTESRVKITNAQRN